MRLIKNTLIFAGGFIAGVAATYFVATRYLGLEIVWEDDAENEIDDFDEDANEPGEDDISNPVPLNELDGDKYKPIEDNESYVNYAKADSDPVNEDELDIPPEVEVFGDPEAKPYLIDSAEFGTDYDYDEIELYWWPDKELLTDCWNYPVEDIERTTGDEAIKECREGDSDVVYVKNDRLKAYYEILKQVQDYPGISG